MSGYRRKNSSRKSGVRWFTRRKRGSQLGSKLRWTIGLILSIFLGWLTLNGPTENASHQETDSAASSESSPVATDTTTVADHSPSSATTNSTTNSTSGTQTERTAFTPTVLGRLPESVVQRTRSGTTTIPIRSAEYLNVCSFNIQFLGNSKKRENASLAELLSSFDLVLVQEMIAPPQDGTYPDGTTYQASATIANFAQAMAQQGFTYIYSEEDTGSGPKIHRASSSTEWWIAFYRPDILEPAPDLPGGFLDSQRAAHPVFQRVPYAFPFRTRDGRLDFVLISVHLYPEPGPRNRARRKAELDAIARIIELNETSEREFLIAGDMNIQNISESYQTIPQGYKSLNASCTPTNTLGTAPFDHVVLIPDRNPNVDYKTGGIVINLIEFMRRKWSHPEIAFPGDPYDHDAFRQYYSDHNPLAWRFRIPANDND